MKKRKLLIGCSIVFLSLLFSPYAYPLPEGQVVVSGKADFQKTNNTLTVNVHTDKLITNFNSFSIAQPETVQFIQPSASSIALNRVVGVDPSSILGNLTANGRIFLTNPNGILFGPNSRVDTAGLVASTLNISNDDFLNDKFNFQGQGGYILNQGNIVAKPGGYVCLMAGAVENQGLIQADLGTAVLASGEKMTLNLDDAGSISVVIENGVKEEIFGLDGEKIDSAIKNSGVVQANGGKVILSAKVLNNVFDYAINNSGIIEAKSLAEKDGEIILVASGAPILNTGRIEAGDVKIEVEDSDFINQGEVITDGSAQVPDAGDIYIEANTILQSGLISANAFNEGDAGEIAVISVASTILDENSTTSAACPYAIGNGGRVYVNSLRGNTTVFNNASIDVSAGSIKGDAGFIEVSAFDQLGFFGILSGRAPPGYQPGTAILDPASASIGNSDSTNSANGIWGTVFDIDTYVWATGDITILGDVTITDTHTLNLFADHKSAIANDWHNGSGSIINQGGLYAISAAEGATNTSLNLKAGSGIGTADHPIKTNIHYLQATNTTSGNINITNTGTLTLANLDGSTIADLTGNPENSDDLYSIISGGDGVISISATGDILTESYWNGNGCEGIEAIATPDSDIILDAGNDIILGDENGYGTVYTGTGNITLNAGYDIIVQSSSRVESEGEGSQTITLYAENDVKAGHIGFQLGEDETTGTVNITAGGSILDDSTDSEIMHWGAPTLIYAQNITLTATNGDIGGFNDDA